MVDGVGVGVGVGDGVGEVRPVGVVLPGSSCTSHRFTLQEAIGRESRSHHCLAFRGSFFRDEEQTGGTGNRFRPQRWFKKMDTHVVLCKPMEDRPAPFN
jgi:hypothetical protein